jgi:hypothetical protein
MGLLTRLKGAGEQVGANIRLGRHIEAYAIFVLGLALAVLGVLDVANERWLFAGLLVGISFLVFHSTVQDQPPPVGVELAGREAFPPLSDTLDQATELWVYGPTANSILVNVADIRRHVLQRAGSVRFIVQDPGRPATLEATKLQLDDNLDFLASLRMSLETLVRLKATAPEQVRYALLPMNPGFSLLVVNPDNHDGYVVLEIQGFQDDNINDRMHMVLTREHAGRWFDYWVRRYEAMWKAAEEQPATSRPA